MGKIYQALQEAKKNRNNPQAVVGVQESVPVPRHEEPATLLVFKPIPASPKGTPTPNQEEPPTKSVPSEASEEVLIPHGEIPDLRGVWATGKTLEECRFQFLEPDTTINAASRDNT